MSHIIVILGELNKGEIKGLRFMQLLKASHFVWIDAGESYLPGQLLSVELFQQV